MLKRETKIKATHLALDIQKHFANGGGPLSMRDIGQMVSSTSSATSQYYVKILKRWGVIKHKPFGVRTIVLAEPDPNYPPVDYRKDMRRLNT